VQPVDRLGQVVALVASAGAALLVWTGWAMSWRRFFPRRSRRGSSEPVAENDEARD
jgi:predicted permease